MRAILTLLTSLAAWSTAGAAGATADLLVYRVEEAGLAPYVSRILVTPGYLRMDEGTDDGGYTLFDRAAGVFYNVDPEDRSVMVIDPPRTRPEAPVPLVLGAEPLPDIPREPVAGAVPEGWRLLANGEVCVDLVAAPGIMDNAVTALAEFYERLSFHHGAVIPATPPDLIDACDLADNVFAPARLYAHGLPLRQSSPRMKRELVDHGEAMPVAPGLFEVPADYRRLVIPMPVPERPAAR